ncbi:MAG: glycosyltransferase family 1 protein, partial [Deltaproteobacteria bacterium]|nr:glycosyltransferase family 1 protein [Deltaproteobacteria bacterium]
MNIVCVHVGLRGALEAAGHRCLDLRPPAGVIRLEPLLGDFVPDVIFQQETLGPRTIIADLGAFSCLKVFWSIDTHLNSFWHQYYARLFDLCCSTQKQWLPWFAARGLVQTAWLPWFGSSRPVAPWEERVHGLGFVGRITPERPVRQWFAQWLDRIGDVQVRQDLPHGQMLDFYDKSRIVPNEAIFGEINFRLFEAASCGCAVLNPAVGHVEGLFEPDSEVALYRDGAELVDWVCRLRHNDVLARLMGLRAWERIQREHLPEHRARALLARVGNLERAAQTGPAARVALWLTLFSLWEGGRLPLPMEEMER